jgi:hypothetical protein
MVLRHFDDMTARLRRAREDVATVAATLTDLRQELLDPSIIVQRREFHVGTKMRQVQSVQRNLSGDLFWVIEMPELRVPRLQVQMQEHEFEHVLYDVQRLQVFTMEALIANKAWWREEHAEFYRDGA